MGKRRKRQRSTAAGDGPTRRERLVKLTEEWHGRDCTLRIDGRLVGRFPYPGALPPYALVEPLPGRKRP